MQLNPTKYSRTISNSVLVAKQISILQKYAKSYFRPDLEKFPLLCLPVAYSCHRSLNGVH